LFRKLDQHVVDDLEGPLQRIDRSVEVISGPIAESAQVIVERDALEVLAQRSHMGWKLGDPLHNRLRKGLRHQVMPSSSRAAQEQCHPDVREGAELLAQASDQWPPAADVLVLAGGNQEPAWALADGLNRTAVHRASQRALAGADLSGKHS